MVVVQNGEMIMDLNFCEIDINKLEEYDKIPFYYDTNKKYEIRKIDK